jgi:endonuclease YncB( thermonuclease family)
MTAAVRSWFGILGVFCAVAFPPVATGSEWETLEGCRLLANDSNDGDSFHVKHEGEEYIFRLYFVDAPETSEQIPSRVTEQAERFGVPRERVLEAGKEAAALTAQKLSHPFTVRTKWQDAEGQSRLRRSYAFIETADGKDLGELLAAAGYVRSFGVAAAPPGKNEQSLRRDYDRLADRAQSARLGAWGNASSGVSVSLEDDAGEEPAGEGGGDQEGVMPGMPAMDAMMETLQVAP